LPTAAYYLLFPKWAKQPLTCRKQLLKDVTMGTLKVKNDRLWSRYLQCVAVIACAIAFAAGVMIPVNVAPVKVEPSQQTASLPHRQTKPDEYVTRSFTSDNDG
jgi:hypothetical protein